MKFGLILTTAAFVVTSALAPIVTNAADLTPAQTAKLEAGTKAYYKALVTGDAATVSAMTTPDYKMVTLDGTPVNMKAMQRAAASNMLQSTDIVSHVNIHSVNASANQVVETVTIAVRADQFTSQGTATRTGTGQHQLTWVKDPTSGKWLVSKDVVLKSFKTH